MKKKLEGLWSRCPRLGRGGKTVRNLLLTLALAVLVWAQYGYPLPTAEMEFRRLERQNLLPRSEIVFAAPRSTNNLEPKNGSAFTLYNRWAVGTRGRQAVVGYLEGKWSQIDVFPLNDGPSPVPLSLGHVGWIESVEDEQGGVGSTPHIWPALLFLEMPEAARGELVLDVTYREKDYHRVSEGWDLGDDVWLFVLEPPESSYSGDWYQGGSYTLTLYREDGSLLLEQSGTIPRAE